MLVFVHTMFSMREVAPGDVCIKPRQSNARSLSTADGGPYPPEL
jgi:hypothetical protein